MNDIYNCCGIILAGGKGTRLYPITNSVCKAILPVYDKPLIYYSLSTLMLAGIRDILIISSSEDIMSISKLLGDGNNYGIHLSYDIQKEPKGIAEAFLIGEKFINNRSCCLILGDNIFYGAGLSNKLKAAVENTAKNVATIFGYYVNDPERFGIAEIDSSGKIISIEEKPKNPKSNYCITGLYFYPASVVDKARYLKPSSRGELEITDINCSYLKDNQIELAMLNRGNLWFDAGTHDSLLEASNCISMIEKHQNLKISCLEEIALLNNWITANDILKRSHELSYNDYGKYILGLVK